MFEVMVKSAVMPDIQEYVTPEEAANDERVPFTQQWIRTLADRGKITGIKIGEGRSGRWLIHLPSLLQYIDEMNELGSKKFAPND